MNRFIKFVFFGLIISRMIFQSTARALSCFISECNYTAPKDPECIKAGDMWIKKCFHKFDSCVTFTTIGGVYKSCYKLQPDEEAGCRTIGDSETCICTKNNCNGKEHGHPFPLH